MNQVWSNPKPNSSSKPTPKIQNFLESLRHDQAGLRPDSPFGPNPFLEINRQKELEKARVAQFHAARIKEWESVYSAKDKQIQKQIEQIREELQKLAKQVVKYDQNIKQAIQTEVVKPGSYHLSFFEHIRQIIEVLRKNVTEANSWLSVFKKRSKSKGVFWTKSKTGGSAYMFSGEHAITRSVG